MPIARVQMPDGRIGRFEVPEGTTPEQIIQSAQGMQAASEPKAVPSPTEGMSALDLGLAGAGKAIVDLGRGARQLGSKVPMLNRLDTFNPKMVQDEINQSRSLDAALMDTTAGKVGNMAGLVGASLLAPGVGTMAGSVAAGAGLGALQPTVEGESRGLNTAIGAGAGAAGKFAGDKIGKWLSSRAQAKVAQTAAQKSQDSVRNQTLAAAQAEGYTATPSQAGAGLGSRLLEGLSGKAKTEQLAVLKNQGVTDKLVRKGLGLPDDAPLTSETMQAIRNQAFAKGYEPVTNIGLVSADKSYQAALNKITMQYTSAARSFPGATKNDVSELVKPFRVKYFDAGDAVAATRVLREDANVAFRAGNTALGKAHKDLAKALEDKIERQLAAQGKEGAATLKNFRDARTLMAKAHTVEDALQQGGGRVDAHKFAARIQRRKPMSDEFKTIGEFANSFRGASRLPQSGDANPLTVLDYAFSGVLGYPTAGAALALPAARVASRYGMLSKPYQRALVKPKYPSHIPSRLLSGTVNNRALSATYPGLSAGVALEGKKK